MAENQSTPKALGKAAGSFLGHGAAIAAGLILMITGIAMGVTIVMLPVGVLLGLAGLFVFLWGLFGSSRA